MKLIQFRHQWQLLCTGWLPPTTTRSGLMKSLIAFPSFRNSGLEATSKSILTPLLSNSSWITARTFGAVPTGTVLFVTTNLYYCFTYCGPMVRALPVRISGQHFVLVGGVPTALNITSTSSDNFQVCQLTSTFCFHVTVPFLPNPFS